MNRVRIRLKTPIFILIIALGVLGACQSDDSNEEDVETEAEGETTETEDAYNEEKEESSSETEEVSYLFPPIDLNEQEIPILETDKGAVYFIGHNQVGAHITYALAFEGDYRYLTDRFSLENDVATLINSNGDTYQQNQFSLNEEMRYGEDRNYRVFEVEDSIFEEHDLARIDFHYIHPEYRSVPSDWHLDRSHELRDDMVMEESITVEESNNTYTIPGVSSYIAEGNFEHTFEHNGVEVQLERVEFDSEAELLSVDIRILTDEDVTMEIEPTIFFPHLQVGYISHMTHDEPIDLMAGIEREETLDYELQLPDGKNVFQFHVLGQWVEFDLTGEAGESEREISMNTPEEASDVLTMAELVFQEEPHHINRTSLNEVHKPFPYSVIDTFGHGLVYNNASLHPVDNYAEVDIFTIETFLNTEGHDTFEATLYQGKGNEDDDYLSGVHQIAFYDETFEQEDGEVLNGKLLEETVVEQGDETSIEVDVSETDQLAIWVTVDKESRDNERHIPAPLIINEGKLSR